MPASLSPLLLEALAWPPALFISIRSLDLKKVNERIHSLSIRNFILLFHVFIVSPRDEYLPNYHAEKAHFWNYHFGSQIFLRRPIWSYKIIIVWGRSDQIHQYETIPLLRMTDFRQHLRTIIYVCNISAIYMRYWNSLGWFSFESRSSSNLFLFYFSFG